MKLTVEKINELLGINESYKASERLMKILFNKEDFGLLIPVGACYQSGCWFFG